MYRKLTDKRQHRWSIWSCKNQEKCFELMLFEKYRFLYLVNKRVLSLILKYYEMSNLITWSVVSISMENLLFLNVSLSNYCILQTKHSLLTHDECRKLYSSRYMNIYQYILKIFSSFLKFVSVWGRNNTITTMR